MKLLIYGDSLANVSANPEEPNQESSGIDSTMR